MNKVYCDDCKFLGEEQKCDFNDPNYTVENPYRKGGINPYSKNSRNNCSDYNRKWWKIWR